MAWLIWVLVFTVLMSVTMLGCGVMLIKSPPTDINAVFGYRTKRSMADQKHWDFAQQYAGRVWVRSGIANAVVFLTLTILCHLLGDLPEEKETIVGLILTYAQLIPLLIVIPMTEHALKRRFED